VHVKKKNIACKYDDIKGNDIITKFLKLEKHRQTTIAKLSFNEKLKDGYRSISILNKVPGIEDNLWFRNASKPPTVFLPFKAALFS
jgi:hypothetical protein